MVLAIYVPDLAGHRRYWLDQSLASAVVGGIQVCVYTSDFAQAEQISVSKLNLVTWIVNPDRKELLRQWRNEIRKISRVGICFEADKILPRLLFAKGEMRLLIMRPYLEQRNLSGVVRFTLKQACMFTLSLRRSVKVSRLAIPYSKRQSENFRWIRDDINTELFLDQENPIFVPREIAKIADNSKVITLCGFLDARKNPITAYRIVEKIRKVRGEKVVLILAGLQTNDFKDELSSLKHHEDVIQIDRLLLDSEFKGLLKRSDLVLLPYSNKGASGIVLNSLVCGTPVAICGNHNWRNLKNYLGEYFLVLGSIRRSQIREMNNMLELSKKSAHKILRDEEIPSLSEFLHFCMS